MSKLSAEKLTLLSKTVAMLSVDGVQKANSGHPGLPMGAALYTTLLWSKYLNFNPKKPDWINRDRFILSAGHGSMLLYSLLHIFGYNVPIEQIKNFRQWDSITPGHPEYGMTEGVEATTGPLGQGAGNAVGMALSGKLLAEELGADLINYKVYALVSDGDLMEGIASEAASLAGHLKLNNLIYLYDDNKISLAGKTEVCFTENVQKRFESYNWYTQTVDSNDIEGISKAIENAQKEKDRPSIILVQSVIGEGSPKKANSSDAHGSPLGDEEVRATKRNIGWPEDKTFFIPPEISELSKEIVAEKTNTFNSWEKEFESWKKNNSDKAKSLESQLSFTIPKELSEELKKGLGHSKPEATRSLSGKAIQVIAKYLPSFIGGSADLEPSTKTLIKETTEIQAGKFKGRNIRYGVREHAMGAVANGLAYCKAWIPFTATFLVFSDYMRASVRLAALSHLKTLFVFTHDSFWVGEDGPTHEPIEHIQSLRLIPNLYVYRPADGIETGMSYYAALQHKKSPSALIMSRQDLPVLERESGVTPEDVLKGGYVLSGKDNKGVTIIATGSEVWVAQETAKLLKNDGINARVVSMPCVETFFEQDKSYRDSVIPPDSKKISLEAGVTWGWQRVAGMHGLCLGIDHYGASAPGELLAEKFGFTPDIVKEKISAWLK